MMPGDVYVFFFNDTATTEIYTLSLHDALPIFLVAFGFAFWQNDAVLEIVNRPFIKATSGQKAKGALATTRTLNQRIVDVAARTTAFAEEVAADERASAGTKRSAAELARASQALKAAVPPAERQPV